MSNAVDFEKMRKRRQRATTVKRLLALCGIMLLLGAVLFVNDLMVEESVPTRLSDFVGSFGGDGYPADLPGGIIRNVGNLGDNLTVLNDTNLYIFNPKAKVIRNIQRMNDQTVVVANKTRILTYAIANKTFSVHTLSRELFTKTLEYGVMCGDMNDRGDIAVVAPVKQFASKVYVYNKKFEEVYSWSSPEYVTAVSLSPKGDMMAVSCLSGRDGELESLLYLFRFSEEREQAEVAMQLTGQLVLDLKFLEDNRIHVLTDRSYFCLDTSPEQKESYDLAGRQIIGAEYFGRETLLLVQEREGKKQEMILLDGDLSEKAAREVDIKIKDMAIAKDAVYTLTAEGIQVYTPSLAQKARYELRNISNIHVIGSKLYYLTPDEICELYPSDLIGVAEELPAAVSRSRSGATARSDAPSGDIAAEE